MRLTLTQFVTLDGVYQGPGAPDEDTTDGFTRGGWMVTHMDQTFITVAAGWLQRAGALLLGRRTYEAFAMAWPQNTDPNDPFAHRMNALPSTSRHTRSPRHPGRRPPSSVAMSSPRWPTSRRNLATSCNCTDQRGSHSRCWPPA